MVVAFAMTWAARRKKLPLLFLAFGFGGGFAGLIGLRNGWIQFLPLAMILLILLAGTLMHYTREIGRPFP